LPEWNARRQSLAARYDSKLHGLPGIHTPAIGCGANHVYHLYVVRCASDDDGMRRKALAEHLAQQGIETRVHYPAPVHLLPAFDGMVAAAGAPVSERLAREVLSLPMFPQLSPGDVGTVAESLITFVEAERSD
jgi:dTDP-4-amino-4,6-dideoxygalactose transaminase